MNPNSWKLIHLHTHELQQLVNRLDSLIAIKNQETKRLEGLSDTVTANIQSYVDFLDQQIKEIE